jgi:hypothetical protein
LIRNGFGILGGKSLVLKVSEFFIGNTGSCTDDNEKKAEYPSLKYEFKITIKNV